MLSVTEKDGATIIVIENPTGSEQRIIEQAKKVQYSLSAEAWKKFACNQKKEQNDFMDTLSNDDYPF